MQVQSLAQEFLYVTGMARIKRKKKKKKKKTQTKRKKTRLSCMLSKEIHFGRTLRTHRLRGRDGRETLHAKQKAKTARVTKIFKRL